MRSRYFPLKKAHLKPKGLYKASSSSEGCGTCAYRLADNKCSVRGIQVRDFGKRCADRMDEEAGVHTPGNRE